MGGLTIRMGYIICVCLYRKFAEITQFCIHLPCVGGGKRFRGPHNSCFHEGCSDSASSGLFLLYQIKLTLVWKTTKTEKKTKSKTARHRVFSEISSSDHPDRFSFSHYRTFTKLKIFRWRHRTATIKIQNGSGDNWLIRRKAINGKSEWLTVLLLLYTRINICYFFF